MRSTVQGQTVSAALNPCGQSVSGRGKDKYCKGLFRPVMHQHGRRSQGKTEHDTCGNQFDDINMLHLSEPWSPHDDCERNHTNNQRENNVSPGWTAVLHEDGTSYPL